jgi:hypothetical protein
MPAMTYPQYKKYDRVHTNSELRELECEKIQKTYWIILKGLIVFTFMVYVPLMFPEYRDPLIGSNFIYILQIGGLLLGLIDANYMYSEWHLNCDLGGDLNDRAELTNVLVRMMILYQGFIGLGFSLNFSDQVVLNSFIFVLGLIVNAIFGPLVFMIENHKNRFVIFSIFGLIVFASSIGMNLISVYFIRATIWTVTMNIFMNGSVKSYFKKNHDKISDPDFEYYAALSMYKKIFFGPYNFCCDVFNHLFETHESVDI